MAGNNGNGFTPPIYLSSVPVGNGRIAPPLMAFFGGEKKHYRATVGQFGQFAFHYGVQEGQFSWYDIPKMRQDPRVKLGWRIIRGPLDQVTWKIKAKNTAVAQTVDKTLRKFWTHDLDKAVRMIEWGSAACAVQYKLNRDTQEVEYDGMQEFCVLDAKPLQINGKLVGISVGGMSLTGIMNKNNDPNNPSKFFFPCYVWFANEAEFGSYYGRSRYAGAWAPWMEKRGKKGAIDSRRLWYFKLAMNGGIIWHPMGAIQTDAGTVSCQDYAREIVEKGETGQVMTLPSIYDDKGHPVWKYEPAKINGEGKQFLDYPKDLDGEITEGMEIPREVVAAIEAGNGLGNNRSVPFIVFLSGEDAIAKEIISTMDKAVCRPIVAYNYGPEEDYEIEVESLLPKPDPNQQQPGQGQPGQQPQPPQPGQQQPGQQPQGMAGLAAKQNSPQQVMGGGGLNPAAMSADVPMSLDATHLRAPKGHGEQNPLYIAGKPYVSGEFIPHAELAKATEAEKAALQASQATENQAPQAPAKAAKRTKRVLVDEVPYYKEGSYWINEHDPDTRASNATMDKWRMKGRVKDAKDSNHPGDNESLEAASGAGAGERPPPRGTVGGDAGQGAASQQAATGEGVREGLPGLPVRAGEPGEGSVRGHGGTGNRPDGGAGVGAAGTTGDNERVVVGDTTYVRQGNDWINEAKPDYRVSEAGMQRWRAKGRVHAVGEAQKATPENPIDHASADFRYSDRDFAKGGLKEKLNNNIAAIQTLQAIKLEGRDYATPEEQQILSKYVGWGQFPGIFKEYRDEGFDWQEKSKWEKDARELRQILTDDQWRAARKSTLNAHYTAPDVVDAHWKMAQRLGFKGGRFLETSAGIGYYLGMMPADLAGKTAPTAVEIEPVTGEICKLLYPKSNVQIKGFEQFKAPNNFYDLVASNVPFGGFTLHDPDYNKYGAKIHDYFFLKSADLAKPGGLVMHITSTGTMDKGDPAIRKRLAEQCDFVGAIRFPAKMHKANAGTDVVTDLVILRKKDPSVPPVTDETPVEAQAKQPGFTGITTDSLGRLYHWKDGKRVPSPDWLEVTTVADPAGGEPIPVNKYFAENPHQILGQLDRTGTMRHADMKSVSKVSAAELTEALGKEVVWSTKEENEEANKHGSFLFADGQRVPAEDIERVANDVYGRKLADAINRLPQNIVRTEKSSAAFEPEKMPAPDEVKDGGYAVKDGKLFKREGGGLVQQNAKPAAIEKIQRHIEIRDAMRQLIQAQRLGQEAGQHRAELNRLYDAFVNEHGFLHATANLRAFADDPDAPNLLALEKWDAKKKTATKADMFVKNTIRPTTVAEKADSPTSALAIVLHETGGVDIDRMAKLLGKSKMEVAQDVVSAGIAFHDPAEGWKPADLYLSGNVRRKLALAREAAKTDPTYAPNVAALEKVQPEDIHYGDISVKMGAPWVHRNDYLDFLAQLASTDNDAFKLAYLPTTGAWTVGWESGAAVGRTRNSSAVEALSTDRVDFIKLVEAAMNNTRVNVYDTVEGPDGKDVKVLNQEATAAAAEKTQEIKEKFGKWIWEDDERRERLSRFYNDNYNNIRAIQYNGSHLKFPGMNPNVQLHKHIPDFVWQVITTGRGLAAHEVGMGKTYAMIASAMELRRLGLANKPAIACLKANIEAITADARHLYPGANILSTADFYDAKKRQKAMAQIATGNYDMVILTHDHLNKLKMLPETEAKYLQEELDELEAAKTAYMAENRGTEQERDPQVKKLEEAKEKLKAAIQKALAGGRKDDVLYFEDSGIDHLFVDEAHKFKTLPVYTKQGRVKGIPSGRSQRATNMLMRTRWLMQQNKGRGVTFATGTPVMNTMAELYTMQRYLQPDELKERHVNSFDAWANVFGEINTKTESTVSGERKSVSRFSSFSNVPELMQIAGTMMDVQRITDLPPKADGTPAIPRPNRHDHAIVSPHNDAMQALMADLQQRAADIKQRKGPPQKGEDNMLVICVDGRKGAIDMRLLNPNAPDNPDSKVNKTVANVLKLANENPDKTQIIFSDVGVHPGKAASRSASVVGLEDEDAQEPDELSQEEREEQAEMAGMLQGAEGFHLYNDIISKLVKGGIPREQIADFSQLEGKAKEEAQALMREGKIRVALGGTQKLGTGVNVQNKLMAMHHLDVPWFPADIEQRDGRGYRFGNQNKDINIFRYVAEGSLDEFFWQLVSTKAHFIKQVMTPAQRRGALARNMADPDTTQLTPDQLMAIASGDMRLIEQVQLKDEIGQLEASQKRHDREQQRLKKTVEQARGGAVESRKRATALKEMATNVAKHTAAHPDFEIEIGGQRYTERPEAEKALDAEISKMASIPAWKAESRKVGKLRGLDLYVHPGRTGMLITDDKGTELQSMLNLKSVESMIGRIGARATQAEADAAKSEQDAAKIEKDIGKQFGKAEELRIKRERHDEIERQLNAEKGEKKHADVEVLESPGAYADRLVEEKARVQYKGKTGTVIGRMSNERAKVRFDDGSELGIPGHLVTPLTAEEPKAKEENVQETYDAVVAALRAGDKERAQELLDEHAIRNKLKTFEVVHLASKLMKEAKEPASMSAERDVSGEPRDEIGRWTTGLWKMNEEEWKEHKRKARDSGQDLSSLIKQREKQVQDAVLNSIEGEWTRQAHIADSTGIYPGLVGGATRRLEQLGLIEERKPGPDDDFEGIWWRRKQSASLSAERAPTGYTHIKPLHIAGHDYVGGQWIPGNVVAQASAAEKAQLHPEHSERENKYTTHALENLKQTSRTAQGTVDTSASPQKAAKITPGLAGDKAAALAHQNFERVIRDLHNVHRDQLSSPEHVGALVDRVNQALNHGITKAGTLLRTDDSPKYPYTKVANLPLARQQFAEEFHKRLTDPEADPIETAAWAEWRINMTDHAYADGCGKTGKAMAAMALMHAGLPLPSYTDNKTLYGFAAPVPYDPHKGAHTYTDNVDFRKYLRYYKSQIPTRAAHTVRKLEAKEYPPANPEGVDTFERHQAGGKFTEQRQKLHDKITDTIRHGIPSAQGEKVYTMMGGGPASGKSSALRSGKVQLPEDHVKIDSDSIKEQLPEYHQLIDEGYVGDRNNPETGHLGSASYLHEESSHLAKVIQKQSLAAGQHVVLDGTGDNSVASVMKKVNEARQAGYKVHAEYATCSVNEAMRRNQVRAWGYEGAKARGIKVYEHEKDKEGVGRLPPEGMLRSVHKGVSQVLPELVKQGAFDNVRLWDTEGGAPVLVMSAQGNKMTVHHAPKWQQFLAKATE